MVGCKVLFEVDKILVKFGVLIIEVENLNVYDEQGVYCVKDVLFIIWVGEIFGIVGVVGNG